MSHHEVGVLAIVNDAKKKVVIITTRGGSRWIFPKGQTEKGRGDKSVALDEAFEEAGLIGTIEASYVEFNIRNGKESKLRLYPMKVRKVLSDWPEIKERKRQILSISQARKHLSKELHCCLDKMLKD